MLNDEPTIRASCDCKGCKWKHENDRLVSRCIDCQHYNVSDLNVNITIVCDSITVYKTYTIDLIIRSNNYYKILVTDGTYCYRLTKGFTETCY